MIYKNKKNKTNMKSEKFDVVIIGGGQTGLLLAKQLIKSELKTLIIDKNNLGIKSSLDLKNFIKLIKRYINKNEDPKKFISEFPEKLKFINEEQNKELISFLHNNSLFKYEKGIAKEINEFSLKINDKEVIFNKLVFATGSHYEDPKNLNNLKKEMYFNLDEIAKINKFYESVAIYGTNPQALELAYAFSLLGSNVYIFDENVNPFNNFDDDFESILKTEFMTNKINWCLESKILNHIASSDTKIRISYTSQNKNKFIEVEKIFLTENKKSNTKDLNTINKIPLNSKGSIIINNTFKVKENSNYYAIGDVNGIFMLPSHANGQAMILSKTLTSKKPVKFNPYNFPFIVDIEPQICFFGMSRQDLEFQNMKYNEFIYDFNNELNSKLYSHKSKMKIFTNDKHEILGAFLYGHKIKELLAIFIIAANYKIKFYKLSTLNFPFYSKSEFLRDAANDYEIEFVGFNNKNKKKSKKIK